MNSSLVAAAPTAPSNMVITANAPAQPATAPAAPTQVAPTQPAPAQPAPGPPARGSARFGDWEDMPNPYVSVNATLNPNASGDPSRILTETRDLSVHAGRTPCKIMGLDAICFQGREGPLIVSDVIGAAGCVDRLFIGATESDTPQFGFHWVFEIPFSPIMGARLLVRPGEWLQYAIVPGKKKLTESGECQLTWSGFKP